MMKPIISFGYDVPDEWKKKWLKENHPECYDDFFPPEEVEKPSPNDDKLESKKGRKGGN